MAVTSSTNQSPQPIIDLILADINAVIPNLSSLVASYRLLVGASEEIHRTPEVCPEVFERAVRRADNAGTLIDIFLELLCCKIAFSSEFLKISCAPVDLFRLLANRTVATDTPFHSAEQVIELEALRRIIDKCHHKNSCLPDYQVVCPKPPPSPSPPTQNSDKSTDIQELGAVLFTQLQSHLESAREESPEHTAVDQQETDAQQVEAIPPTHLPFKEADMSQTPIESRVRRKHLKDAYDTPVKPKKR